MIQDRGELASRAADLSHADCVLLSYRIGALSDQPMPAKARKKIEAAYNAVTRAQGYLNDAAEILEGK